MFGISWAEFLVILLVAVLVIPARLWPDVAKFLARAVKFIRAVIWKITDASEKIKEQIERESPIDDLIKTNKWQPYRQTSGGRFFLSKNMFTTWRTRIPFWL